MVDLSITEKFLLLAQHPDKGKLIISGLQLQYGVVGALLLQMTIDGQITLENNLVSLKSGNSKAEGIVLETEQLIRNSRKKRKLKYWVSRLSRKSSKFKKAIQENLAADRMIRIEPKKFLGLIPYKNTYLLKRRARTDLIKELKDGIFSKREVSNDQMVLLGLIEACKMQKIFSTDSAELKRIKKALKEIMKENPIAGTVDKTIKEVQAAIFTTIIASSVVTSASH